MEKSEVKIFGVLHRCSYFIVKPTKQLSLSMDFFQILFTTYFCQKNLQFHSIWKKIEDF